MTRIDIWPVYGATAAIYLIAMHFSESFAILAALKVLPIFLLIALLFREANKPLWLWPALIFSACGDVLLALPLANGFLMGLGAFLLAQLAYAYGFWREGAPLEGRRRLRFGFVAMVAAGLAAVIVPATGELMLPVSIYLMAIAAMALGAARYNCDSASVFVGALLFVLSDSVIAINKFIWPFEASGLVIMVTYYAAQVLMVTGVLTHYRRSAPPASQKTASPQPQ